jgi:hypothetical protein
MGIRYNHRLDGHFAPRAAGILARRRDAVLDGSATVFHVLKKRLHVIATAVLLAAGLGACGDSNANRSSHAASSTPSHTVTSATAVASETAPAPLDTRVDRDDDNDVGAAAGEDSNNRGLLAFGHPASPSERRAISALIKNYYAIALAGDGARGCSLLYSTLAEAAVEDDAQPPGPPYMRGAKSCAEVLTLLFRHYHAQLTAEVPKLRVRQIRLREHSGFALLRFGALAERQISIGRERQTWKMNEIYDQELP